MELVDKRKRQVLGAVVENHIKAPVPVGSKTLSRNSLLKLQLSPATIRTIMAELDEMGYITQPHPSAGRLPTDKGYRFFIEELMTRQNLSNTEREKIDEVMAQEVIRVDGLLEATSSIISTLSSNAALVLLPKMSAVVVNKFFFLKISPSQTQAVLKTSIGRVINLLIEMDENWSETELSELSNFLNRDYAGQTLRQIRLKLRKKMKNERAHVNKLRSRALKMQEKLIAQQSNKELLIEGTSKLLDHPEFKQDAEKMKRLIRALSEKQKLIKLLDKCLETQKIEVTIGSELAMTGCEDISLVTTHCGPQSNWDGTIGVLGPRSMDYAYTFSLLAYMSGALKKFCSRT